jgi:hypothetical protein
MRRCVACGSSELDDALPDGVNVCRACELKRQEGERKRPDGNADSLTPAGFVARSGWRLAETMLDAPHQYTVRDLSTPDARGTTALGHAGFEWFARLAGERGVRGRWGNRSYRYYELDGWEYWTMGLAPEVTTIINRRAKSPATRAILDREVAEVRNRHAGGDP